MAEIEVSGESRYDYGPAYVKYLLDELSVVDSPGKLESIASQVKLLQGSGTISKDVADALLNFIKTSSSGTL